VKLEQYRAGNCDVAFFSRRWPGQNPPTSLCGLAKLTVSPRNCVASS
jgi:hypothetical protein